MLYAEVVVTRLQRLSPTFVRVELGGPALADFGFDGPTLDLRFKLLFPHEQGPVPRLEIESESWYADWLALPPHERGHMRTYTLRDVVSSGADTRLVVDVVVHEDGLAGPGAAWALGAKVGDRIALLGPRRGESYEGAIEFRQGAASSVLLVGDESAVPAVAAILRDLPRDTVGCAFLEVPHAEDVQELGGPDGVRVTWHVRGHAEAGTELVPAVRSYVGLTPQVADDPVEVDPDLWETRVWSSSGEPLDDHQVLGHDLDGVFAWIAGESSMVTRLRRALVREVGVDRRQVAFMGYWRRGVAMKG